MAFIPPRTRGTVLDGSVELEVTGAMRFLNRRDPLIASQMQAFAYCYSSAETGGPADIYLLPQALLELKTRLSSLANTHVILDSGLIAKRYRDELLSLFKDCGTLEFIEELPQTSNRKALKALDAFL